MQVEELKAWRKAERARLLAARDALVPQVVDHCRHAIDSHLERGFPGLRTATLAFCWPIRNESDARHLARTLREAGALTALPVVVAPKSPLVFREWHPGVTLAKGPLDIPYPVDSRAVVPRAVLLPMNGWDARGSRLGYGGGFFDRTLASLGEKPLVIGVSYEMARMATIHPQPWDVPMAQPVRYLLLAGLLLNLALLTWVLLAIPSRAEVTLGFGPGREPVPAVQFLLLPIISGFFYLLDAFLGLYLFRRAEGQAAQATSSNSTEHFPGLILSYLLWGSGVLVAVLFLAVLLFIL